MERELDKLGNPPQADFDEKFAEYLACLDEMQWGVPEKKRRGLRKWAKTNFSLFMSIYEIALAARRERLIALDAESQTAHKDRGIDTDSSSSSGNAWAALVEQFRRGNQDDLAITPDLQPSYVRLLRAFEAADIIMETAPTGVERIILFGSTARGQARLDSDIDIAVVRTGYFDLQPASPFVSIPYALTNHGFRMGTEGEDMPLNIQFHYAYLYSNSPGSPHSQPANFEAIMEIKKEGIILREGDNSRPPTS